MQKKIFVGEEFDRPDGTLPNYDSYDQGQFSAVSNQSHADIRVMESNKVIIPVTNLYLDTLKMSDLDTHPQGDLVAPQVDPSNGQYRGTITWRNNENWTAGTLSKDPLRNHWRELSLFCAGGQTTTSTSVITPPSNSLTTYQTVETVDISSFDSSSPILVTLPDFPGLLIDSANSFIDFTSNLSSDKKSVDFSIGPTVSIPFAGNFSTNSYGFLLALSATTNPQITSDVELVFPQSALAGIDLTSISGVRFRVKAFFDCTFKCLGIRQVGEDWQWAPLDVDTRYDKIYKVPSPSGSLATATTFPESANPAATITTEWPVLFRSDTVPGLADPRPIDASYTVMANAGSLTAASSDVDYAVSFLASGKSTVGNNVPLQLTQNFTLETWAKFNDITDVNGILTKFNDVGGSRGYRWGVSSGEVVFEYSTNLTNDNVYQTTGANLLPNVWYHLALVYRVASGSSLPLIFNNQDVGSIDFYINGTLFQSFGNVPLYVASPSVPFEIAAWNAT